MLKAHQMMIETLKAKGVYSGAVIAAMSRVERHLFVSEALRYRAYDDISLPIGFGQTISRPSVIARMLQSLGLTGSEMVLEVGTGSGYQTAVLSRLASGVVTMERVRELSERAGAVLSSMNCRNAMLYNTGNFSEIQGSFDGIVVSAGADMMPEELFDKLNPGGRMIIPVSDKKTHRIKLCLKRGVNEILIEDIGEASFVPLVTSASA
ncbi:MAG: protein-L-isoaspartate(D-aspartate) O-methyltransferase [Spirochaetes bacterium]|jgi:protein-L-isoaspartate(D-aspartate) O-methyltransferase|nr:protein-L-isoaspartate(D-aspartate) O-methyltransferase [Spirochaetota bacterium]